MPKKIMLVSMIAGVLAFAHPMGNFSVNHYARLEPAEGGVRIRYVMDLAEIPTFELFQQWGAGADPKHKAFEQMRTWAAGLQIRVDGRPAPARVERAEIVLAEGAGNMQVARISADLMVEAAGGTLTYEDRNYQGRSGWKEIVIPGRKDRSAELTVYPQDPLIAPPQEVTTALTWKTPPGVPQVTPPQTALSAGPAEAAPAPPSPAAPGTVV